MARDVKAQMAAGAARLLAQRGLQATSFSEVLALTGAPRGSIYHHFPDGKDQLVTAAVELAGDQLRGLLEPFVGAPADEVAAGFLGIWKMILERSQFTAGCAVVAVTVAADEPDLLDRARDVFRAWRSQLAELLERGGLPKPTAAGFAVTLIAASEGAVIISRAERSLEPFELVSEQLLAQVRQHLAPATSPTPDPHRPAVATRPASVE